MPSEYNIHRRYPEVAVLIPGTMGRACGGLCASCQRMYSFQKGHLNFDLQKLRPKKTGQGGGGFKWVYWIGVGVQHSKYRDNREVYHSSDEKNRLPGQKAEPTVVASSTDGQLMPPIMGAAAFIIAAYVNVLYIEVVNTNTI